MPRAWFDGIAGLMGVLGRLDLEPLLPRIVAPTLVIGAELDGVFPVENSRALATAIAGARLEILEGAGHGAVVEAPERVLELVEAFLEPRSGSGPPQAVPAGVTGGAR
jgi:3-oxoadipate enol-lactonase